MGRVTNDGHRSTIRERRKAEKGEMYSKKREASSMRVVIRKQWWKQRAKTRQREKKIHRERQGETAIRRGVTYQN
ncbi:hypothetical protein OF83DRAFT_1149907 [Amylostereum chailletii]|nr:hypothetical protein OF83DRAFT_1149907 [Amylostereum chailletii]